MKVTVTPKRTFIVQKVSELTYMYVHKYTFACYSHKIALLLQAAAAMEFRKLILMYLMTSSKLRGIRFRIFVI